jgi:cob(I)alamin adenosyltransferase
MSEDKAEAREKIKKVKERAEKITESKSVKEIKKEKKIKTSDFDKSEGKRGTIYVYTGTGAGKTTNALGIAMRCVGHGEKVVIVQFLKWWKSTGEYKIMKRLKPLYEIHQFGRKGWVGFKHLKDEDKELAQKGFEFAKKAVKTKKPRVIILDEINLALHLRLINKRDVIDWLLTLPADTHAVLTGRYAPEELWDVADFVNIIVDAKHPNKLIAVKGIQY